MSPTRRQVVSAIAAGSVVPATVTSASAQQEDDQEFSPEITINSNNLVATIGERDGDADPDTVTIHTADGSAHEFDGSAPEEWQRGEAFDVGYTHEDSRARIEGWYGIVERVTATKDGQTVEETNENGSSLQVSCSLWQTPDEPPTEFTALSEGARKQHWNRGEDDLSEDQRRYGSPGRPLWTVAERTPDIAMRVDFVECEPESQKALWFDCTTVTVTEDELNQGEQRIEDVQLRFADGTTERPPGTADEADNGAYEVPVTLSGSGDNEGKVIERLQFKVPRGEYTYWNLEAEECQAQQDDESNEPDGSGDSGGEETPEDDGSGDGPDDGSDDSDGGSSGGDADGQNDQDGSGDSGGDGSDDSGGDGGSQSTEETDTQTGRQPSGDDTGSDDPAATQDSTGGDSGSSGGGGSTGGSEQTPETETPQSVDVGTETAEPAGTETADGAGGSNASTASGDGGGGDGSTVEGPAGPEMTEGVTGEDGAGMGVVPAIGGLLGLGELARRRLGADESIDAADAGVEDGDDDA